LYPANDLADHSLLLMAKIWRIHASRRRPGRCWKNSGAVSKFPVATASGAGHHRAHLRAGAELAGGPSANIAAGLNDFRPTRSRPQADYAARAGGFPGRQRNQRLCSLHEFCRPVSDERPCAAGPMVGGGLLFRAGDFVDAEKNFSCSSKFPNERLGLSGADDGRTRGNGPARLLDAETLFHQPGPATRIVRRIWTRSVVRLRLRADAGRGRRIPTVPRQILKLATNVFVRICQLYPTNELGALAWGEIGDCALQLAAYDAATNAYAQVVTSPFANISARSQAQIGLGTRAGKKRAAAGGGGDQTALLQLALQNYLDVLYGKIFTTAKRRTRFG